MDAPCAGGGMLTGVTTRACCEGFAGSGALGCAHNPGGAVAFAWVQQVFSEFLFLGVPSLQSLIQCVVLTPDNLILVR